MAPRGEGHRHAGRIDPAGLVRAARPGVHLPSWVVNRQEAVRVIVGASKLVGANGLYLTEREVEETPERVRRALHTLGVTDDEIAAVDTAES